MSAPSSKSEDEPPARGIISSIYGDRFTHRLEAFSDLVFGFSLSLLATRLNRELIPAEKFFAFLPAAILIVAAGTRLTVRRLPGFLDASRS